MAKIGLTNLWYSHLTEGADGTPTYDGAKTMGKAVSCQVDITNNSATLYGDDALAESDTSFANGTMTLGTTDDDDTIFADLLGHQITTEGEVTKTATDVAPYVGVGRIVTKMVNGVYKYTAKFIYKVKFSEPSADENTRGENVEFSTGTVEGMISTLGDEAGTWNKEKTFTTKSDALTWLKGLMDAPTPTTTYTVTYNVNGGSGTVAPATVTAGESVTLNDGSGITPPSNKTFSGWGLTEDATETVASPYTPTGNVTLYAVYTNQA
jgi:phi13 family phage major tail protein